MKKLWQSNFELGLVLTILVAACGSSLMPSPQTDGDSSTATERGKGTVVVRANGEERVRNGFTTKDGLT